MNLKMSNKLNDFWDDCLDQKNLELNLISNIKYPLSLISSKTKQSTSTTINNESKSITSLKFDKSKNFKNKSNFNNITIHIQPKKINLITQKFLEKWSPNINDENKKKKVFKNKLGRNILLTRLNKKSKSKSKTNNLSSEEIRLKKNLSECTFHPKISPIKSKNLQEKLLNYSKYTMYERGQIFQMKKQEDKQRMVRENRKKNNIIQYLFKPEIHKCPSFKKVFFNGSNYDSLNYFYTRMNSARKDKMNKKKKMPFNNVTYDEIYKNKKEHFNRCFCHHNSKSRNFYFMPKKNCKYFKRELSGNLLMKKMLYDKNEEKIKQNLHKLLMELELNKN